MRLADKDWGYSDSWDDAWNAADSVTRGSVISRYLHRYEYAVVNVVRVDGKIDESDRKRKDERSFIQYCWVRQRVTDEAL